MERPRQTLRDASAATLAAMLLLLAAVWGLVWYASERARADALAAARAQLDQMAGAITVSLNRGLVETDALLVGLPGLLGSLLGPAPAERAMGRVLRDLNNHSLFVRDLLLLDAEGRPIATALPTSRRRVLRLDWVGGEAGGLRLAGPLRNPSTHEWSVYVAREVELQPGAKGLAVGEIAVSALVTLFGLGGQTASGRAGTPQVRLEDGAGTLLALLPHDEALIGRRPATSGNLAAARAQDGREVTLESPSDGPAFLQAVRPTVYPHIVVGVSLGLAEALQGWRHERSKLATVAAAFSGLILLSGLFVLKWLASRSAAERERQRWRAMLENALESMADGFVMFDRDDRLVVCNSRYREMYRVSAPFLVPGASFADILREGALRGQYPQCGPDVERFVAEAIAWHRGDHPPMERLLPDGRWLLVTERRTADGGTVGIRTDISALKAAEAEARRRAEEDPLTGLANRAALRATMEALAAGRCGSLILLDVDHFKAINDSHGHPVGDQLLCQVARRLQDVTRPGDTLARLGGDEFAVLLPGATDPGALSGFLGRMKQAVEKPMRIGDRQLRLSLSIGIARLPDDSADPEELMRAADAALYEAKRQGRNRWAFYERSSAEALLRRSRLAERLKIALGEDRIEIVLQPKLRLADSRIVGFEALARWREEGNLIPPSEFVPVAEEHGLGLELGWAVLRKALAAQRGMLAAGLDPGRMAVNFSTTQLLAGDLVERLATELLTAGLSPQRMEVEITETVLLDRSAEAVDAALRAIAALGIGIALDDFGTGYASLSHLARMPVSQLKIDRRFVTDLTGTGRGAVIARSMIALARGLGIETVAEGVETAEQYALLAAEGCDVVQGYLISRPLSVDMATGWLRQHERKHPARRPLIADLR